MAVGPTRTLVSWEPDYQVRREESERKHMGEEEEETTRTTKVVTTRKKRVTRETELEGEGERRRRTRVVRSVVRVTTVEELVVTTRGKEVESRWGKYSTNGEKKNNIIFPYLRRKNKTSRFLFFLQF